MQDVQYLTEYVGFFKKFEDKRILMIENTNLEFLYMTKAYKEYMNIKDEDIIGRKLKDSNHPGKELAKDFKPIALKVIETKHSASFFITYKLPHNDEKQCILYTFNPIINPATNNVAGLTGEMQIIDPSIISKMFSFINASPNQVIALPNPVNLSDREKEVLFLLTLGHNYKEAAAILSKATGKQISASTINSIIHRQLFKKFDAINTAELVIKSAQLKTLQTIPSSILELRNGIYELTFQVPQ
jgi:DNA-binding CsgD family transcriptional regulator